MVWAVIGTLEICDDDDDDDDDDDGVPGLNWSYHWINRLIKQKCLCCTAYGTLEM